MKNSSASVAEIETALAEGLEGLPAITASRGDAGELCVALARYIFELEKWNKAYNLTAVRDPREMVARHILDSLSAAPYLSGERILDAGTGAGLPGIPLALICPEQAFTLLDANGKKTRFVQHAVGELGLHNVFPVHARAEDYEPEQAFATVISRAFTSLTEFIARCGRQLEPGGRLVAMKGRLPEGELLSLPAGWQVTLTDPVSVAGLAAERHIIVLEQK